MHASDWVIAVSGSTGEHHHTWSLTRCTGDSSTTQRQQHHDQLNLDHTPTAASAGTLRPPTLRHHRTEHSSASADLLVAATLERDGSLERDGFRPASRGPTTQCLVVDATESLQQDFEGVSGYSFQVDDLLNVTRQTADLHQASCDERSSRSVDSHQSDKVTATSSASVQITDLAGLDDRRTPRHQNETATMSQDGSRLHSALKAQCTKLLHYQHNYCDIENQLLPDVGDALDTQAADTDEDVSDTQLSTEMKTEWLDCISLMSNCSRRCCDNGRCRKAREMVTAIERSLRERDRWSPTKEQRQVLYVLAEHGTFCHDVVMCRIPWCFYFFHCNDLPYNEQIASLRRFYSSKDWDEWTGQRHEASTSYFLQVDTSKDWPSIIGEHFQSPQPNFDFTIINTSFDRTGYINYVARSLTIPLDWLRIIQYPTQEWTASVWEVLKTLKGCDCIVNYQWVNFDSTLTTVCTTSPVNPVTLEDILANGVPWKPPAIWQCTSRLIRAARALHQIGILYMRWKADGIILSRADDISSVQLADFSCAVTRSQIDIDCDIANMICSALPAETLSPEMSADECECDMGEHSDVWGLGCLMYHMMIGVPIHDDCRHEPHDQIPNKIRESLSEKLTNVARNFGLSDVNGDHVLRKVLVDKKYRISLSELEEIVEQLASGDVTMQ